MYLILTLWALILSSALYLFGLSGVIATLIPNPANLNTISAAIPAWIILLLPLLVLIWRKVRRSPDHD